MTTTLEITTNPAVQTAGQTQNSGLSVARDGLKNDTLLDQLESVISSANSQTLVSGDSSNSAVTVRISKEAIMKLITTLRNTSIVGTQVMTACVNQLTQVLDDSSEELVDLNRGNVSALATTAHELEEIQSINTDLACKGRLAFLPAAGTEYVSHADPSTFTSVVNNLNIDYGNDTGTRLLKEVVSKVPTDVGLSPKSTTIREGNISLDSMAAVRPVMQNHGQDSVTDRYLESADAFSSCDAAITPLASMGQLLKLAEDKGMVQSSPYPIPKLIVTKNDQGYVTNVELDTFEPITAEEIDSLDMTKSLVDQDWSAVRYSDNTRTTQQMKFDINNWRDIPDDITRASGVLVMVPSNRIVSGATARGILSGMSKLWNTFKNYTGASNANVASLIGQGASLAGNLIGGTTGATIAQVGNFVSEGAAAFSNTSVQPNLCAKWMFLNGVPNLTRLAYNSKSRDTVSSMTTATAVERFSRDFSDDQASSATRRILSNGNYRQVRVIASKYSK